MNTVQWITAEEYAYVNEWGLTTDDIYVVGVETRSGILYFKTARGV